MPKRAITKKVTRAVSGNKRTNKIRNFLIGLFCTAVTCAGAYGGYVLYQNHAENQVFSGIDLPHAIPAGGAAVHFIDVGQGDAVLIHAYDGSNNSFMLIDAADRRMSDRIVRYLRLAGVKRLDYVIATHPHADHIGGFPVLFDAFEVGTIIMPEIAHTTRTFERLVASIERHNIPVKALVPGTTFTMGSAEFTIISPNNTAHTNLNNHSVGVRMVVGDTSFVFAGDLEAVGEQEIIDAEHYLRANVLMLPHHGSNTSTSQPFFDAVSPGIAVISVGRDNRYGHPHSRVLERLSAIHGIHIARTDRNGHIIITTNGYAITTHIQRGEIYVTGVTE